MKSTDGDSNHTKAFSIDFIDPLFAVILHIGYVDTVLKLDLLHKFGQLHDSHEISFRDVAVLLLGFANVILSWHGYHMSVLLKPIKGGARFYLDIVCLVLYLYVILCFQNHAAVAWLLVAQFGAFCLWDVAKATEYAAPPRAQVGVSLGWGAALIVPAVFLTWGIDRVADGYRDVADFLSIAALYTVTLAYRLHKSMGHARPVQAALNNWLFGTGSKEAAPPAAPEQN